MSDDCAGRGAPTVSYRDGPEHMERCKGCGVGVRWDMVGHFMFGFKAGCGRELEQWEFDEQQEPTP